MNSSYICSHLLSKMGHLVSRVNRGERSTAGTELDPYQLCWRVGAPFLLLFDNSILFREDTTSRWCATEVDDDGVMMPVCRFRSCLNNYHFFSTIGQMGMV